MDNLNFEYKPNMQVVRSARNFIQSLCETYGTEKGLAVWDYIRKGLGDEIAGDIFLGMLTNSGEVTVSTLGREFISAIKEVRSLTGWSLKEAKDFCDSVRDSGPRRIDVTGYTHDRVDVFVRNMKNLGCTVE